MTEWMVLFLLVPAVVLPVVLLLGFAGCSFSVPGSTPPFLPPVINSVSPESSSILRVVWMGAPEWAQTIEFERTLEDDPSKPVHTFSKEPSETSFPDSGLNSNTLYSYIARAVDGAGEKSEASARVAARTLAVQVAFDATGAGGTGSGGDSATANWTHTASGDARAVVVGLRWTHTAGIGTPTRAATYGGTSMASLGVIGLDNEGLGAFNGSYHEFFGLLNPSTSAQTVSITVSRTAALSTDIEGCSISYVEVSAFGPMSSVFGTEAGTSLSQTVSSALNEMVVQMFTTASGPITSYNQALRFDGGTGGPIIGDALGATSVIFTASRADSVDYAGLAVRLTPAA